MRLKLFEEYIAEGKSGNKLLSWTIIVDGWPEKTACIIDKDNKIIDTIEFLFDQKSGEYSKEAVEKMKKHGIGGAVFGNKQDHHFVGKTPQSEKDLMAMRKEKNMTPEEAVAEFTDDSPEHHQKMIDRFLSPERAEELKKLFKKNENESSDEGPFFKLKKDVGGLKKGKKFDCFGGLVKGITVEVDGQTKTIDFDDKEHFEMI